MHGGDFTFAVGAEEDAIEDVRKTSRCVAFLAVENVTSAIEILGRRLRWRKEGLEYEGCDKHRQALSEGFGLGEDSKTVNSAAVKPEEMGQEEDEKMLEGTERDDVHLSHVKYAAKEIRTKMANPTRGIWKRLKKVCRYSREVEKVTCVMRAWKHDGVTVDVHVDSDCKTGPEAGRKAEA